MGAARAWVGSRVAGPPSETRHTHTRTERECVRGTGSPAAPFGLSRLAEPAPRRAFSHPLLPHRPLAGPPPPHVVPAHRGRHLARGARSGGARRRGHGAARGARGGAGAPHAIPPLPCRRHRAVARWRAWRLAQVRAWGREPRRRRARCAAAPGGRPRRLGTRARPPRDVVHLCRPDGVATPLRPAAADPPRPLRSPAPRALAAAARPAR